MLKDFTARRSRAARDKAPPPQALFLATAAAQLTDQDDFGATCTTETQAVLACAQKTCPDVTVGASAPWTQDSCSVPGCDTSTCQGIKDCGAVQCRAKIKFDKLLDA